MSDPAYWEKVRQKALEEANLPGATEDDRKKALEKVKDAEQQLHRIMHQRAPQPDKKPIPIQD
jgi:hypothetical protein